MLGHDCDLVNSFKNGFQSVNLVSILIIVVEVVKYGRAVVGR